MKTRSTVVVSSLLTCALINYIEASVNQALNELIFTQWKPGLSSLFTHARTIQTRIQTNHKKRSYLIKLWSF